MLLPALLVASILGSASTDAEQSLATAAAVSGRPPECASAGRRGRAPTVWQRARIPELGRYCDLIARAHAALVADPRAARAEAERADALLPGRAAPKVVMARASLATGSREEAVRLFDEARALDPRSVEEPRALLDWARALRRGGKLPESLAAYRALASRIDLYGTSDQRVEVLLEAAFVSMALREGAGEVAAAGLDEAAAFLREARQRPVGALTGDVLLASALALDRAGARAQADALLGEASRGGAVLSSRVADYVQAPDDKAALEALALELSDRARAAKAWEAYLAGSGGKGAWAASARGRLEALRRSGKDGAPSGSRKKKGAR